MVDNIKNFFGDAIDFVVELVKYMYQAWNEVENIVTSWFPQSLANILVTLITIVVTLKVVKLLND